MLHFLNLEVTPEECRRLARKFVDPVSDNVNYAAFCEAIDPFYKAAAPVKQVMEDPLPLDHKPKLGEAPKENTRTNWDAMTVPNAVCSGDNIEPDVLMSRLRHLVLVNRIQLKKFFEDFDVLRTGRVTKTQFERALTLAGITRLALHDLTPAHVNILTSIYASKRDPAMVHWRSFVHDVDTGTSQYTYPAISLVFSIYHTRN